jgi:hypothetical protein
MFDTAVTPGVIASGSGCSYGLPAQGLRHLQDAPPRAAFAIANGPNRRQTAMRLSSTSRKRVRLSTLSTVSFAAVSCRLRHLRTESLTPARAEWRGGGDARIIGGRIES